MAIAAFLDHFGLEQRQVVRLNRVGSVAVGAARRCEVAFLAQLAVLALREVLTLLLVAGAASVGDLARDGRALGSDFGADVCAPWQLVQVGAEARAAPASACPWMLSWNLLATLPPGSFASRTIASLPWHLPQVASRFAWLVRESGSLLRLMSCVPWQSAQVAATVLPPLRAMPCTVDAYSFTGFSWQLPQSTGFSFSACGSFFAETSAWQAVHSSFISPCTDLAKAAPSTAIDFPAEPFASLSPWHARQVSFGSAAAGAAACAHGIANKASPKMAHAAAAPRTGSSESERRMGSSWGAASPEPTESTLEQHPRRVFDISQRRTTRTVKRLRADLHNACVSVRLPTIFFSAAESSSLTVRPCT